MDDAALLPFIRELGVPAGLAVALVYSLWRAAGWLAQNVITPLMVRQMKFFDDLDAAFDRHSASIAAVSKMLDDAVKSNFLMQEKILQKLEARDVPRNKQT